MSDKLIAVSTPEERCSATEDDGVNQDAEFVDETELKERRGEGGATDLEIPTGFRLQLGDLVGDVVPNQRAVPLHSFERPGKYDLGLRLRDPRKALLVFWR
jgi:hypothetical protein